MPDEIGGAPVVAVLSTVVLGADDFTAASAVLSVGLLDGAVEAVRLDEQSPVAELLELDPDFDHDDLQDREYGTDSHGQQSHFPAASARYVMPVPDSPLALLAEFSGGESPDQELLDRFERLVTSFRWAS